MEIASPVGTGTVLPRTEPVNDKNQCSNEHSPTPQMPPEMLRANLDDSITATLGLLDLLEVALASPPSGSDAFACPARRSRLAYLCHQASCQLFEALDQSPL
jgi:hypothetical protein